MPPTQNENFNISSMYLFHFFCITVFFNTLRRSLHQKMSEAIPAKLPENWNVLYLLCVSDIYNLALSIYIV